MTQPNDNQGRLYTRFISILKLIQYAGYFVVVIFSSIIAYSFFSTLGGQLGSIPPAAIFGIILQIAIAILLVYISTQSLIAIVDLLSRIERNLRVEPQTGRATETGLSTDG